MFYFFTFSVSSFLFILFFQELFVDRDLGFLLPHGELTVDINPSGLLNKFLIYDLEENNTSLGSLSMNKCFSGVVMVRCDVQPTYHFHENELDV